MVKEKNPKLDNEVILLHLAAKNGQLELCQSIIDTAVDKNPKAWDGWTPLHLAAMYGHFKICQLILKSRRLNHAQ